MIPSEPTFHVTDWQTDQAILKKIRREVFIIEQNVPESMEWDEFDDVATHYIIRIDNQAVACARLKPDGQIGRMAVLSEFRNRGIGSSLLKFILRDAEQRNIRQLYLHAQVSALTFYKRLGFREHGDVFDEAGISHQMMKMSL